jgi:hypothetical protein
MVNTKKRGSMAVLMISILNEITTFFFKKYYLQMFIFFEMQTGLASPTF